MHRKGRGWGGDGEGLLEYLGALSNMPTGKSEENVPHDWKKQSDKLFTKIVSGKECRFEFEHSKNVWTFSAHQLILDSFPGVLTDPPFGQLEQSELKFFRNGLLSTRKGPEGYSQVLTGNGWRDLQ